MKRLLIVLFCIFSVFAAYATDAEANECIKEAAELHNKKSFRKAAARYMDAVLLADTPALKANALIAASLSYRNAKLYGKEFDCIERLIKEHIAHVDFQRAIDRQFEIADTFFDGHRDTAVFWLPFIKDSDRTREFYEAALQNASCAKQAPNAKLRLGNIYLDDNKPEQALPFFREIISMHPETEAARYASLELMYTYMQLARRGDGDGAWSRLAKSALTDFLAQYPNDPEVPWAKKALDEINTLDAKRMHGLGAYYHRTGRDDLAERYLARVIRDHGETEDAKPSERLLAQIDEDYTPPPPDAPRKEKYVHTFKRNTIPIERNPILVVPENSDGKWLLPIRDLKADIHLDSNKDVPERMVNKDEF